MSGWRRILQRGSSPGARVSTNSCGPRDAQHEKSFYFPAFREKDSLQQVFRVHRFNGWVGPDAQIGAVDVQLSCRDWTSHSSVPADGDPGRPAGYESSVMRICQQGQLAGAVEVLRLLVHTGCQISKHVFYVVLKQCVGTKDLRLGRLVHSLSVTTGYESDTFLCNHILRMYNSFSRLQEAVDVFSMVAKPDVFTWSAIISAHVKQGQDRKAMQLYRQMRRSGVKPNSHVFVAALQACAMGVDLESGQQVHSDVVATGFEADLFVCNCLVDMYAKCGSLAEAKRVFDGVRQKDVVTWNAMIAGYSQQGMGKEALSLFTAMQDDGMAPPDSVTFVCLLQACASVGTQALQTGRQLHWLIREQGLQSHAFVVSSLVTMYAKCGSLEDAQGVFDNLREKNLVTWNAMIAGYSQLGMGQEALSLYRAMQGDGIVTPNSVTIVCLLHACATVGNPALKDGKDLHVKIREGRLEGNQFAANSLVNMYAKCGSLEDAESVFNELDRKDVVTWNAMIAAYSQQGMGQEALDLYKTMQEEGMRAPDSVTFVSLLQACASVGTPALTRGKQLHAQIGERGLQADSFIANSLVNMYVKCGSLDDAEALFHRLPHKDVVTWNVMIAGYSRKGLGLKAFHLLSAMRNERMAAPNSGTFLSLLQACASVGSLALENGRQLHSQIREQGLETDVFIVSSLINMYAKCGSLEEARGMFDGLVQKDVAMWSAMIAGYSQQGMGHDALRLYRAMEEEGSVAPNCVTFACLLQACASVAALHLGRQLHAQITEQGLQADVLVAVSLIDMYGKCSSMVEAQHVFQALPEKDVVAWNALIGGYTRQGDCNSVFDLVVRMREDGIQPDRITFLSVLTVCSHTGLVDKGREYFEVMSKQYGIKPTADHYTCMVDLLGRSGQLDEALALIRSMPIPPNAAVWHTLLAACRKWSNVEVGCSAFHEAVKLDQKDSAAYVLMLNIYTDAQMWEQAQEMQARRKRIRAWKEPGRSWWTDMAGQVHSFLVGFKEHPTLI